MGAGITEASALWHRVEQLVSAAVRMTSEHDLDRVLMAFADSAREVIGAQYAAIGVLNEEGSGLGHFVSSGLPEDIVRRIGPPPRGLGILGLLIKDPHPLRLKNLRDHPASYGFPPHHPEMTSFLGVPIPGQNRPIGNLYLTNKEGAEEFSAEDEAFAVMLAAHAAVAVQNARLIAQVRAAQHARERFYSTINHELRNALTAVYGWAELLLRKAGEDPPRPVLEVYESAERTLGLLEDLLDLSRMEAGRLLPAVRQVDARRIVKESVATIEPAALRKGIPVEVTPLEAPVTARTDPQRVRQILINLLTNAVRHSPEGKPVRIEVQVTDETLAFAVIDHGEGIAPEKLQAIFEPFERAGRHWERGTGLGLAVSRRLAQLLGGTLSVESRPGRGARFTLTVARFLDSVLKDSSSSSGAPL